MELNIGRLSALVVLAFLALATVEAAMYFGTFLVFESLAVVFGLVVTYLLARSAKNLNKLRNSKLSIRGKHAKN